jgi:hypothetical protein
MSFGTEVQMLPWLPNGAPPQSRIKFCGAYTLSPGSNAYFSYATGNLGKTLHEIGIGYHRQFNDIFHMACSYDLSSTPNKRWKSTLKVGYALQSMEKSGALNAVRGFIDSACKLACYAELPLKEGLTMGYCAKFDFYKNVYDLGVSINMAPSSPAPTGRAQKRENRD